MRRELRQRGFFALHRLGVRLADHLDLTDGVVEVVGAEIEVVHAERLLEDRVVGLLRERNHRFAVVVHVIPADLIRAVRQAVGVLLVGRGEQDPRAVGRAGGHRHDVCGVGLALPVVVDDHAGDGSAGCIRLELHDLGPHLERDVRHAEHGPHRHRLGVGLRMHQTGVAVAPRASDAGASRPVGLVEQDPARRVERVVARLLEVVR